MKNKNMPQLRYLQTGKKVISENMVIQSQTKCELQERTHCSTKVASKTRQTKFSHSRWFQLSTVKYNMTPNTVEIIKRKPYERELVEAEGPNWYPPWIRKFDGYSSTQTSDGFQYVFSSLHSTERWRASCFTWNIFSHQPKNITKDYFIYTHSQLVNISKEVTVEINYLERIG